MPWFEKIETMDRVQKVALNTVLQCSQEMFNFVVCLPESLFKKAVAPFAIYSSELKKKNRYNNP
jgi:hypothetical protein